MSVADGDLSRESNPRVTFHRPDGTLRAPLFGSQGGGVYVRSNGVANFEGCDIHDNTASYVCLPSALALNFHPSPHCITDSQMLPFLCAHGGATFFVPFDSHTHTHVTFRRLEPMMHTVAGYGHL